MVELDAKRYGARGDDFSRKCRSARLTRRYGFHFVSLIADRRVHGVGYSPALSVFYATG